MLNDNDSAFRHKMAKNDFLNKIVEQNISECQIIETSANQSDNASMRLIDQNFMHCYGIIS